MTHILDWFYNWSFAGGALLGLIGMRLYVRQADRRSGNKSEISRMWIAGLITVTVLGYVLLTAQRAAEQTVAIAMAQKHCQDDLNKVVKKRSSFTERSNALTQHRSDLLDDLDEASADWLNQLLTPSAPDIADLPITDPRREAYGYDVTRLYFINANKIRAEIADVKRKQTELAKELAANPIPPLCAN